MWSKIQYEKLSSESYYIDKTEPLERGLRSFPSIYVEGAAASGKTTAIRMLLERMEGVTSYVFWMDEEEKNPSLFLVQKTSVLHVNGRLITLPAGDGL